MPLDGITLGFIARELEAKLMGARVDKISQPDHDLVILTLRAQGETLRLLISATPGSARMHLSQSRYENPDEAPMFCMLMRKHLAGGRVTGIRQLGGDRLIEMRVTGRDELESSREKVLYFEAMGKHSNLTLTEGGRILDALRHVSPDMSRVRQLLPGLPYEMPPVQDKLDPGEMDKAALAARMKAFKGPLDRFLADHVTGVSRQTAWEMALRVAGDTEARLDGLDLEALADRLAALFTALPGMASPRLLMDMEGTPADALPFPFISQPQQRQEPSDSLSQAVETRFDARDRALRLAQRAASLNKTITNALNKARRKLAIIQEETPSFEQAEELRVMGELITANLHALPRGAESVTLPNYYTGGETAIPLDPALPPSANAQRYFKRYRKAHTARKLSDSHQERALSDIALLEESLYFLERAQSNQEISELRAQLALAGFARPLAGEGKKKKKTESPMMRFTSSDGFIIIAGRNAGQNERLLREARGEDIWLHARDVPGSHVLITAAGRAVPRATIQEAAKIAAFYSQSRGKPVQVDYTLRKNVRKIPGGGPGLVHYTGEKGLTAQAQEPEILALAARAR
ncbi:MAG: NFACT RNA binding domain-containing protein [Eubacteriales bacterium]|jgi:predicted ribosome quality control (RQC) complex YloA/Tae2 family protein|nr:NFACT RNA binding domain-containing protein [Eubacteriales bacterium]MDD4133681.1 NFACT RNA binding domain-containing protein [Eubacteriales bacterium]NLO12636.1 fibronectin/fibrinogen-binding protein [Clostridiales bacterium]